MPIAIVGDHRPENPSHSATDAAFAAMGVEARWVPTSELRGRASLLGAFDGVLIAPGSPYASMEGALEAIRYAREERMPILGTCGGFQHMVIEFARNVVGVTGADHAETNPDGPELVVMPLACSLAGQRHPVRVQPGTLAADLYQTTEVVEPFFCSFGLNPLYRTPLEGAGLRFSGDDPEGEPRIVELPGHPFFLGTLYVPQANIERSGPHPLVAGFVAASRAAVA